MESALPLLVVLCTNRAQFSICCVGSNCSSCLPWWTGQKVMGMIALDGLQLHWSLGLPLAPSAVKWALRRLELGGACWKKSCPEQPRLQGD